MILTIKTLHDIYYQYEQIQDTYCGYETDWKLAYSNLYDLYKFLLYGKARFRPVKNERLIWLINFISQVECDKVSSIIRLDFLLSGK